MWMWIVPIFVAATVISARVSWCVSAKRTREAEERTRKERRKARLALEAELLTKGPGEVWSNSNPDAALRSLRSFGNVGYLVWLLNCEPLYRDHRGQGEEQYPPDWELRRAFVLLRDGQKCQGRSCEASSSFGASLDCHHIKPISAFGPEEEGIHALSNLVTLCPICHASQHPGNTMLARRATDFFSREQRWPLRSKGRTSTRAPKLSSPIGFDTPTEIEVHSHPREQPELSKSKCDQTEKEYRPKRPDARKAGSITEGLAIVDEQVKAAEAGMREEPAKPEGAVKWWLELEGLEASLRHVPGYKLADRAVIQSRIDHLKNRIRGVDRTNEAHPNADPQIMRGLEEARIGYPTSHEKELMEYLGFHSLRELQEFLNLPTRDDLNMQPPDADMQELQQELWRISQLRKR